MHLIARRAAGSVSPQGESAPELHAGKIARTGRRTDAPPGSEPDVPVWPPAGRLRVAGALACNLLLAGLYLAFAVGHVDFARRTGEWATTMPLVLQESILVVLFLTRRRSVATSNRLFDWVIGIAGVFLPLLVRATDHPGPLVWVGQPLQVAGLALAVVSVACLGRSIGVVAAHRGIKTAGTYAVVRHPMYAAYMVSYVGYVLVHPSLRNLVILSITVLALNVRAAVEERLLARDPEYDGYRRRIRWRFVPYLY